MARRGRKPGEPTLKNGIFYAWHPTMKRKIPLNTSDFDEAVRLQSAFYEVEEMTPVEVATQVVTAADATEDNGNAKTMLDSWRTKTANETDVDDNSSDKVVLSGVSGNAGTVNFSSPGAIPAVVSIPGTANETRKPVTALPPKIHKGKTLDPEQAIKLARGMKQMITQLNMVAVGAAVSIFRSEIDKPDQETLDILEMGIELQLERWFKKSNPEPWMIILGANMIMAVGMWSSGKPRLKPNKPKVPPSVEGGGTVSPIKPGVA